MSLEELSSGTRVQLLMAARLAFIETMEQGPQLPLILDETFANSDDVRARAVMDATIEICRRGRQVVYFTARHEEVAQWESRVGHLATMTMRCLWRPSISARCAASTAPAGQLSFHWLVRIASLGCRCRQEPATMRRVPCSMFRPSIHGRNASMSWTSGTSFPMSTCLRGCGMRESVRGGSSSSSGSVTWAGR